MGSAWPLQEAKNRLSEVVERALTEGPQTVSRRGAEVVVIVSIQEFRRLTAPRESFKSFLTSLPLDGLDLSRDPSPGRDLELV